MNKVASALFLVLAVLASPITLLFGWLTVIGAADSFSALRAGQLGADKVIAGAFVVALTCGAYLGTRYLWRRWAAAASQDEAEGRGRLNRMVLFGYGALAVFGLLHPVAVLLHRAGSPNTATEMLAVGIAFTALGGTRAVLAFLGLRGARPSAAQTAAQTAAPESAGPDVAGRKRSTIAD